MKKILFLLLVISTLFTSCVGLLYTPYRPGYRVHTFQNNGRVYYRGSIYHSYGNTYQRRREVYRQLPPSRKKDEQKVERPQREKHD